jgi:hypothetical protein
MFRDRFNTTFIISDICGMPNIRSRRNLELRYLILTVVKLFFINQGETKVYRSPTRLKVILLEMDDIGEVWPDKLFEAEEMFSNTEWINSKMDAAVQFSQQVTFSKSIQLQQGVSSQEWFSFSD